MNLIDATTPDQVRAAALAIPKMSCGRCGLPAAVVQQMYADYQELKSLAKVGKLYGRTRQSVWNLFDDHGLVMNPRTFQPAVKYKSRKYTPGKNGYLRDTLFRRGRKTVEVQLHRKMWEDAHGRIPAGHQVGFKDGNKLNCTLENFVCLPCAEMSSRTATGENGATKSAPLRLKLLLQRSRS